MVAEDGRWGLGVCSGFIHMDVMPSYLRCEHVMFADPRQTCMVSICLLCDAHNRDFCDFWDRCMLLAMDVRHSPAARHSV